MPYSLSIPAGPRTLNLACGNRIIEGAVNHDKWKHRPEVEVEHDLRNVPWPWDDSAFDHIVAFDILEHIPDTLPFIEELWRVAAPGATIFVHTAWAGPSVDAREVWRDPTHIRPYHELTFHYFDPENGGGWFENYGKFYSRARFRVVKVAPEPPDNIAFQLEALKDGVSGL